MRHGQYESRLDLPKVHKRKVVDVGPRVVLDAERCVLCTRCVRFCDQVTGTGELRDRQPGQPQRDRASSPAGRSTTPTA